MDYIKIIISKIDVSQIVSTLIGAVIAWVVSKYYYIKSAEQLEEELKKFRHWNKVLAKYLDETLSPEDKFNYDKEGNPIGRIRKLSACLRGSSSMTAKAEVKKKNE